MLWRKAYETESLPIDELEIPLGLPDSCAYVFGQLTKWSEMLVWERLLAESGAPVWFGVQTDAQMAQAVIPRSRLERVLLIPEASEEVVAVAVKDGKPRLALKGQATEAALDMFLEALA